MIILEKVPFYGFINEQNRYDTMEIVYTVSDIYINYNREGGTLSNYKVTDRIKNVYIAGGLTIVCIRRLGKDNFSKSWKREEISGKKSSELLGRIIISESKDLPNPNLETLFSIDGIESCTKNYGKTPSMILKITSGETYIKEENNKWLRKH